MKRTGDDHLIPVEVLRVYPYAETQQSLGLPETFMVFLKGDDTRVVAITIGRSEGQALQLAIKKIVAPRPLTHNLLQNLFEKIKGTVHKLVIHSIEEGVFHAYLLVETPEETYHLDCRSSDGMIISTLMSAPIYISAEVMEEAGQEFELTELEEAAEEPLEEEVVAQISALEEIADDVDEKHLDLELDLDESDLELQTEGSRLPRNLGHSELDKLRAQLLRLIAEEAYEEAAKVRDKISQLEATDSI